MTSAITPATGELPPEEPGSTIHPRVGSLGTGFDPASTGYGTGLQGMADRLEAIGGRLEVTSAPGADSTITGRVTMAGKVEG